MEGRLNEALVAPGMVAPLCSHCRVGSLADDGFVNRLHDAVLHQHVFQFVHGDGRRNRAVAGVFVDLQRQITVLLGLRGIGRVFNYRHPTQLYELFWLGGIAWLLRQPSIKILCAGPGDRFGLMLLGVLAGQLFLGYLMPPFERPRLLTEILRGEPMRWFGVLTAAQAIALLMLLTLLPMWWRWVTRTLSQSTQQTTER